ncbi:MAG: GyrI-like domain-containing protein [Acidobacteriota bacterium]|nr:GyrI-like domain-containing protein [Acidobacteriota bacterium]
MEVALAGGFYVGVAEAADCRMASEGSRSPYEIVLDTEPGPMLVGMTVQTRVERLVGDTTVGVYRLLEAIEASATTVREPVMGMNADPGADGDGDIVVHVLAATLDPTVSIVGAVQVELGGGLCASLRHVGPYEELGLAHHSIHAWCQARGHSPRGLVREIYRNSPEKVEAEDLVTEVLLPLR